MAPNQSVPSVARARRFVAIAALAVAATGALALLAPAQAHAEKKRVGIPRFAGPQEGLIRKAVMQAVKAHGYEMIKSGQIDTTVSSLGANLDSNDGFRSVAKELAISAFVTGEVGKKKAKLTVRNGGDGTVNAEETWTAANPRKLAADVAKTFWKRLGAAIERGKSPAGAKKASKVVAEESPEDKEDAPDAAGGDEPTPAAATEEKPSRASKAADSSSGKSPKREASEKANASENAEASDKKAEKAEPEESESSTGGPLPRALDAWIGPHFFFRNLAFHQIASGTTIQDYRPVILGDAALLLDWYPAAHVMGGFLSNIGLELNVEKSFGVSSSTKSGGNYATDVHDYSGALRLRLPLGSIEGGVIVGFGQQAFTLSGPGRSDVHLPDTTYQYLRAGLALRIAFGDFSVGVGGAWRQVMAVDGMKAYFPHLTVGGVDANGTIGYRVTPLIEARVGADLRRYFYDMHSVAADANKAGGAVDQTIGFTLGAVFILDGVSNGHGGSASSKSDASDDDGDSDSKVKPKGRKKAKAANDSESSSEE